MQMHPLEKSDFQHHHLDGHVGSPRFVANFFPGQVR